MNMSHYLPKRTWILLGIFLMWTSFLTAQDNKRKLVKRVEPEYPAILRGRGIGGTVRLKLVVRTDGTVKEVQVVGGSSILVDAATKAVKQWRYATSDQETSIEVAVQFDPRTEPM